jgi:hypothetical protein
MTTKGQRYENTGEAVDEWYEDIGEGSSTFDICDSCRPVMQHLFQEGTYPALRPALGEPVGELAGEVEHPPYSDDDWYVCTICTERLSD